MKKCRWGREKEGRREAEGGNQIYNQDYKDVRLEESLGGGEVGAQLER